MIMNPHCLSTISLKASISELTHPFNTSRFVQSMAASARLSTVFNLAEVSPGSRRCSTISIQSRNSNLRRSSRYIEFDSPFSSAKVLYLVNEYYLILPVLPLLQRLVNCYESHCYPIVIEIEINKMNYNITISHLTSQSNSSLPYSIDCTL